MRIDASDPSLFCSLYVTVLINWFHFLDHQMPMVIHSNEIIVNDYSDYCLATK